MFLQICMTAVITACYITTEVIAGENKPSRRPLLPFDLFLSPKDEELTKTIPLPFRPGDGIKYRKEYKDRYGERGERLIAKLGGGGTPLSIFDAALLPNEEPARTDKPDAYENDFATVKTTTTWKLFGSRKYNEINRKSMKPIHVKNVHENSIAKEKNINKNKITEEELMYKRLFGAIWDYGARGMTTESTDFNVQPIIIGAKSTPEPIKRKSTFVPYGEPAIMIKSYSYR